MSNIETLNDYEARLEMIADEQKRISGDYMIARTGWAKLHVKFQKEIAITLVEAKKTHKSAGPEQALLMRLARAAREGDEQFFADYEQYELTRATYKAHDRAMDALKNQQLAIMGIMKWKRNSELYGR